MGGAEIGPWLEAWAREVPRGMAIVELGAWLGAGTQWLCKGAAKSGAEVHCLDRWRANAEQVAYAARFGVTLRDGEDLRPRVAALVGDKATLHKGDLKLMAWNGGPIGLYVDDASKRRWLRAWGVFGRSFVAGVTRLVMMDFHFPSASPQRSFFKRHASWFEMEADHVNGTSAAVFRYLGQPA
jgi:hypothetical protein